MGTLINFPPSDHDEFIERYSLTLGSQEGILWNDGSLSIEHWKRQYTHEEALPHTLLSSEQVKKLRHFLNKPGVRQTLGLETFQKPTGREPAVSNLGRYTVETHTDKSVTIGTPRLALELQAAEAYRLYGVLHALFQPQLAQEEEQSNA